MRETFIKNDAEISEENLDTEKLNKVLTEYWELAAQNLNSVKRTSDLMSSLRMNLYKKEMQNSKHSLQICFFNESFYDRCSGCSVWRI